MKKTLLKALLVVLAAASTRHVSMGQATSLTLDQAVEYALKNNPTLKNKQLDVEYAKGQVLETSSIGLPQVSGAVNFNQNLLLPVFVFPNPQTGKNEPIRVGQTYSTTAGISVSQLLLDGTYFLGLKAAQEFVDMSSRLEKLNEAELKNAVVKAYYLALITDENLKLVKNNYELINKTYEQTFALYKTGFAEKLDADRLQVTKSNLETQIKALTNQADITKKLLKLNIGMDVNTEITLTDNLEKLYTANLEDAGDAADAYKQRPEYLVLQKQHDLNALNLKRYKVSMVPSLSAFYNLQTATYSNELTFNPWYNTSAWGLSLRVPIFKGLNTKAQLDKVNVQIKQNENEMAGFKNATTLEIYAAKQKYNLNMASLKVQKDNLLLSEEILKTSSVKFENGLGSNLEVISSQQDVRTAQTNYLNAVYDVLVAKADLMKALGKN